MAEIKKYKNVYSEGVWRRVTPIAKAVESGDCEEARRLLLGIIKETLAEVTPDGNETQHNLFHLLNVNFDKVFGLEADYQPGESGNTALLKCFEGQDREIASDLISDLFIYTDPKDLPHIKPKREDLEKKLRLILP